MKLTVWFTQPSETYGTGKIRRKTKDKLFVHKHGQNVTYYPQIGRIICLIWHSLLQVLLGGTCMLTRQKLHTACERHERKTRISTGSGLCL